MFQVHPIHLSRTASSNQGMFLSFLFALLFKEVHQYNGMHYTKSHSTLVQYGGHLFLESHPETKDNGNYSVPEYFSRIKRTDLGLE